MNTLTSTYNSKAQRNLEKDIAVTLLMTGFAPITWHYVQSLTF